MAFAGTYFAKIKQAFPSSSSSQSDGSGSNAVNSNQQSNSNEANYPGILDSELTSLTNEQKNIFIATLITLFGLSVCGNLCTLVVNFRRKIRPFFRACLISLAVSDLMNTIFITTAYLSQFTAEYVQIWRLGSLMCGLVPFGTTAAILASSMTLVGIAVDRYFAVMKAVISFWNPSVISCIVCMLCIWLATISISCPVFLIYHIIPVYILTEEHEEDTNVTSWSTLSVGTTTTTTLNGLMPKKPNITATSAPEIASVVTKSPWEMEASLEDLSYTLVREQKLVNMCISDQKNFTLYYAIVFAIIFLPCIGAFFWFNSIIARQLWKRRHSAVISKRKSLKTPKSKNKSKIIPSNIELHTPQSLQTEQPLQTENCNCRSGQFSSTTMPSSLTNTLGGNVTAGGTGPTSLATIINTNSSREAFTLQTENCRSGQSSSTTMPSSLTNTVGGNVTAGGTGSTSLATSIHTNSSREARHIRMFAIILLLMAVFVFLRLPAWIFLLMRMYGSYTKPIDWILYFVFGLMNLASSVLNPLFYTFLAETIQYALKFKTKVISSICGSCCRVCCCCHSSGKYGSKNNNSNTTTSSIHPPYQPYNYDGCHPPVIMENVEEPLDTISCCENICGCSGFFRATWKCCQPQMNATHNQEIHSTHSLQLQNEVCSKDSGQALNTDKDEGVDCSADMDDEDIRGFSDYNQRIYTIYPPSLVSSSINSQ